MLAAAASSSRLLPSPFRMSKTHVLYAVAGLFATFFALQFYLIHNVSKQREQFYQQARIVVKRDIVVTEKVDKGKIAIDNVNTFTWVSHQHSVPVFVADMEVLRAIMSNTTPAGSAECRFFCHERPSTTFAVVSELWRNQDDIVSKLESEGFWVDIHHQNDPWLRAAPGSNSSNASNILSNPKNIDTHLTFHRNGHHVHLVILYQQEHGFWWYGDCPGCQGYSGDDEHWVNHQGLLDVSELSKVTIDKIPLRAPRFAKAFYEEVPESRYLPCDHKRAAEFRQKYGKATEEETREERQFKQEALAMLAETSKVLNQLGVRFWISSGTCLGWFRQCDIIPYSKDVDVGVWIKDYNPKIRSAMQGAGIPIKFLFGKESDSLELSFRPENGNVKVDVFFFYEDEHYMWNGGTQARTGKKFKYLFSKFSLCWSLLLGLKVRVPCETQEYIKANYGVDWFKPVKEWDWKKSPPNVWENGEWPIEEWPNVIQQF